jgi:DNA repair protein RAD5
MVLTYVLETDSEEPIRLRRAVLHPSLVLSREEDDEGASTSSPGSNINVNEMIKQFADREGNGDGSNETYAQNVLANLKATGAEECPICMDVMEEPVLLPACAHFG